MRVLILAFSPAGSTMKVSRILEKKLTEKGHSVQLCDVTRNKEIFKNNDPSAFFSDVVKEHDVICIGSPVYEKHLEYYVRRLMEQLPEPDGKKWGKYAVSFVTFGGISSGIALQQSVSVFKKSGRTTIACMKLEASHIVTKKLKTRVNENMPGDEALPYIQDLAEKIDSLKNADGKAAAVQKSELKSHGLREKILCTIMDERKLHRHTYPQFKIVEDKCSKCLACVNACSIQRIENRNGAPFMNGTQPECIHCFSCVNACPRDAVTFVGDEAGWNKIERIFSKVAKEGSFFRSTESPKSQVYPLHK